MTEAEAIARVQDLGYTEVSARGLELNRGIMRGVAIEAKRGDRWHKHGVILPKSTDDEAPGWRLIVEWFGERA